MPIIIIIIIIIKDTTTQPLSCTGKFVRTLAYNSQINGTCMPSTR
jgi:hypothetical protein